MGCVIVNKKKSMILVIVLAVATIVSGYLILYMPLKEKSKCTGETISLIESVEEKVSETKSDSDDERIFRCKYKFMVNGIQYVGYEYSEQFNNSWDHEVGDKVNILYNESEPNEFILSPVMSHYCKLFFVPIIGATMTMLSIIGLATGHVKEMNAHR